VRKVIILLITTILLTMVGGCESMENPSNSKGNIPYGQYQDSIVSIKAFVKEENDSNYKVTTDINNHSNQNIEWLYHCGEIITYEGKEKGDFCIEVFSKTMNPNSSETMEVIIPKKLFHSHQPFKIQLSYMVNNKKVDISIPIRKD
jgi:hypothetical protein